MKTHLINSLMLKFIFCSILFSNLLFSGCSSDNSTRYRFSHFHSNFSSDPYAYLSYIKDIQVSDEYSNTKDPLLKILMKYSPDAYILVRRYEKMPRIIKIGGAVVSSSDETGTRLTTNTSGQQTVQVLRGSGFRKWINSDAPFFDQLNDAATAVHEISHGYTAKYAGYLFSQKINNITYLMYSLGGQNRKMVSLSFEAFYRNKNDTLFALQRNFRGPLRRHFPIFSVKKMAKIIPSDKRTFRFKTYILSYHKSQIAGILGLIDEYNAYYWSTKVYYDLYDYYRQEQPQTAQTYSMWLKNISADYFAYIEFRYWIMTYLLYAKKYEIKAFNSLMSDMQLRKIFTRIDDDYTDLINKFFNRLYYELPAQLKKYNIPIKITSSIKNIAGVKKKSFVYILGNHITSVFSEQYLRLQDAFSNPEYLDIINQLRTTPAPPVPVLIKPDGATPQ